jgi:hypothetical protein
MIEMMICLGAGLVRECLYRCIRIATWGCPTHETIWDFAETPDLDEIHRKKMIFTPATATWARPTHERIWGFAETPNLDEIHRKKVIFTPATATIGTISMRAPTTSDDIRSTGMQVRTDQRLVRKSPQWV